MDRDTSYPLSTGEAKARLRAVAQELALDHLVGRRVWQILAVALAGGFVFGRLRLTAMSGAMFMRRLVPLLLTVWLGIRKEHK